MNDSRRPDRFRWMLLAWMGFSLVGLGCGSRTGTPTKTVVLDAREDPLTVALARLEKDSDVAACKEVLLTIDAGMVVREPRPEPTRGQLQPVAALLKMEPKSLGDLEQKEFTPVDAEYLSGCLLVRDGVRSLELKDYAPLKRAELAFGWVCRQLYLRDALNLPAPPWWILEAGSGSGLDRATVFLEVLRQLKLDGCLVGPPELADSVSLTPPRYAPIRAVGVRIAGDIFLFDPWQGKPVPGPDGQSIATFAQLRSRPADAKDWLAKSGMKPDEPARWEIFLAAPYSSFAPRMDWLERQMKSTNPVSLYDDPIGLLGRFETEALSAKALKGVPCRFWNPANDFLAPGRVLDSYHREERNARGGMYSPLKLRFREAHFPHEFIPRLIVNGEELRGEPLLRIQSIFRSEFESVHIAYGSPRDNLLRGSFDNATASLRNLKERNDALFQQIPPENQLKSAVPEWAQRASEFFAEVRRAEESGDASALAKAHAAERLFLQTPLSEKMALLVRRATTRLLSAESSYYLAMLVHEKAERSQARLERTPGAKNRTESALLWKDASDWWRRYLDNYPDLRSRFKDRDDQARQLRDRCKTFLGEAKE